MTGPGMLWTARISIRTPAPDLSAWIERSLRPEAAREVPRAHAELVRAEPRELTIEIAAADAGAMRAALNTYLGWIHLSVETARAAIATKGSGTPAAA